MNSIFLLSENKIEEVHFNLWVAGDKSFLDVGLKLDINQKVELYLPWKNASHEDLFDTIKEKNLKFYF
jgi:hypothetical protein